MILVVFYLREFVCKLPSSLPRSARNGSPNLRIRRGGQDGVRGAQTLRFPGFYARPRLRFDSWPFFRKSGTFTREVFLFSLCNTSRMGVPVLSRKRSPFECQPLFFNPTRFSLEVSQKSALCVSAVFCNEKWARKHALFLR